MTEEQISHQQTSVKINPWMVSTLILIGIVVGYGLGQIPALQKGGSESKAAVAVNPQNNPPAQEQQKQLTAEEYKKLSDSLVDDDPSLGSPDAPVTVVEFSDYQCPFCAATAGASNWASDQLKAQDPEWEPLLPRMLDTYVKEGKVRYVFRDFPIREHPQAQISANAAACAGEQDKYFEMHNKLFFGQETWSGQSGPQKVFEGYAKDLGLNAKQFSECLSSGKYTEETQKDYIAGAKAGVDGTPSFYVNGREFGGAQSFKAMSKLINSLLPAK